MFTFLRAQGLETGTSLVEPDRVGMARQLLDSPLAEKLILPVDTRVSNGTSGDDPGQIVTIDSIPSGQMGVDIGPETIRLYREILATAGTILWNGPMGVFEVDPYSDGTDGVAQAMAAATEKGAVTVVGGGDSASALRKGGLSDSMTHVSTGGGASLEFLEGKPLPGVVALDDRN